MFDKVDLMTKAIQLRKHLGEDSSSPIDIFSIVKSIDNLTLVFYVMSDNLSGMCVKSDSDNCLIAINSAMSLGRQRYSLAHELYHMYYDDVAISLCAKNIGSGKEVEKKADVFASYFLMPADELDRKVNELTNRNEDNKLLLDDIIRIEQYFGMSHKATIIRLKDSSYINQKIADNYLKTSVRHKAEMMGYDSELYVPLPKDKQFKTYGLYIDYANQLIKNDLISLGKYEELLLDAFRDDLVYGNDGSGDLID